MSMLLRITLAAETDLAQQLTFQWFQQQESLD
jgi:hypothetical protein